MNNDSSSGRRHEHDNRTFRSLPEAAGRNDSGPHRQKIRPGGHSLAASHDKVLPDNVFAAFWPWDFFTTYFHDCMPDPISAFMPDPISAFNGGLALCFLIWNIFESKFTLLTTSPLASLEVKLHVGQERCLQELYQCRSPCPSGQACTWPPSAAVRQSVMRCAARHMCGERERPPNRVFKPHSMIC
jgi:hypothetical protein